MFASLYLLLRGSAAVLANHKSPFLESDIPQILIWN